MIAFITICYSLLYILLFNKLKLIAKTNGNISAFIGIGVAMIGGVVYSPGTPLPRSARTHACTATSYPSCPMFAA